MGVTRRRFGDFILNHLLPGYQHSQALEQENSLIEGRQRQESQNQLLNSLVEGIKTHPEAAKRLADMGVTQVGGMPLSMWIPGQQEIADNFTNRIAKADKPLDVPSLSDYAAADGQVTDTAPHFGQMHGGDIRPMGAPAPTNPTLESRDVSLGGLTPAASKIQDLIAARKAAIEGELNKATTPVTRMAADGSKTETYTPTRQLGSLGPIQTGLSAGQEGLNAGTKAIAEQPGMTSAKVASVNTLAGPEANAAGQKAGAEAGARLPFELQIAQTRANMQLLNAQEMDDYRKAHPAATAQELNRRSTAGTALGMIGENRQMLEEMNKRGLIGPLAGRWEDLVTGKIKSEALLQNPQDAKLVADYFTSMKLLSSLAAVAHGGSRGGGSIEMAKRFDSMVNGVGDASIITGQLNGLERLMKHYHEDPSAAPEMIPELMGPAAPVTPLSTGQAKLRQMRGGQ